MTAATVGASDTPGEDTDDDLNIGALVVDQEDDDPNQAVVVNTPPVPADEWGAYYNDDGEEITVADDNPGYDPSRTVVVVVFRDELVLAHPDYEGDEPLPLAEADCRHYAFPPGRLRRTGTFDGGEPESVVVLSEDMVSLRDRLQDAGGDVSVESDDGEPVLVVEKLGAEHRVTADGAVSGGPLADRLRDVAAEYLGGGSR